MQSDGSLRNQALAPIQERRKATKKIRSGFGTFYKGALSARKVARRTMAEVRKAVNLT
jgi:hypothetical protein